MEWYEDLKSKLNELKGKYRRGYNFLELHLGSLFILFFVSPAILFIRSIGHQAINEVVYKRLLRYYGS